MGMMDSLLTLWFTLAVVGWIEGYGGSRKGYLLMAGAMGLAVMTKGAIGFLLPGLGFSIWLLIRRDWRALLNVAGRWIAQASSNAPHHQERMVTNEDICKKLPKSGARNGRGCLLS